MSETAPSDTPAENPADNPSSTDTSTKADRLLRRPTLKSNLPFAQSLRAPYVSLFNFSPADFAFYQQPPGDAPDPLTTDLLTGAFHFDSTCQVARAAVNLTGQAGTVLPALTIEMWVNMPTNAPNSNSRYLLYYLDTSSRSVRLANPVNLQVSAYGGTTATATTGLSLADGQWHHLALVVTSNGTVQLFVDTRQVVLSPAVTLGSMLKDGGNLTIGNSSAGAQSGSGGYFGQVRVWKSARTLPQIIATAGLPSVTDDEGNLRLCWADQVDVSQKTVNDSSGLGNAGTVTLGSTAPNPWWLPEARYGALEDTAHLTEQPTNLTGNLDVDRTRQQVAYVGSNRLALDPTTTAVTLEFWVKPDSDNLTTSTLALLRLATADGTSNMDLNILNPAALTLKLGTLHGSTSVNLCDGRWHHLAVVLDWRTGQTNSSGNAVPCSSKLYLDTVHVKTLNLSAAPSVGTANALLLGGNNDGDGTAADYFSGSLAETRLWQGARSREEILDDASYRLLNPPAELRLYWSFARDFRGDTVVEDFSIYNCYGRAINSPDWSNQSVFGVYADRIAVPPTPPAAGAAGDPVTSWSPGDGSTMSGGRLDGAAPGFPLVTQEELLSAFRQAQATGFFDKRYFPNIRGVKTSADHTAAAAAIADLTENAFLGYWTMGRRLDLVKRKSGRFRYRFIPTPADVPAARLMLVETYRLSSFLGEVGEGQIVRTFTLMPQEVANFSVSTYKETATTAESASSIFDSYNQSSQDSLDRSLGTDQSSETSEAAELDFYADADVKQRWGTGNASVDAGLEASGDFSHSNFFQQTTNAVLSHAAEASAARNVEVNTTYAVQTEENRQTSLTREIRNINSGRTLDLVFRQVVQEYLAVLHLIDIRVGYFDPNPGSFRVVALAELDALLAEVLLDDAAKQLAYKQTIVNQAYRLTNLAQANSNGTLIVCRDRSTGTTIANPDLTAIAANQVFSVNAGCNTDYNYPHHDGVVLPVAGLVMAHTSVTMRTDNVVADAMLGRGVALDTFALGLQAEQLQQQRWSNALRKAEADKLAQANAIVASGDQGKAAVYAEVFPPPRINNNVMYADETGIKPPAS